MSINQEEQNGNVRLKIKGSLSIYEAAPFRERLLACFGSAESLELDLGGVSECDTAGLQLLYAARMTATQAGTPFKISAAPQTVLKTLQSAGLNPDELL